MTTEDLLALIAFTSVGAITPGPNNLMVMSSVANFGTARTLPHIAGIVAGVTTMVLLVGLGLMGLFHAWPPANMLLKILGILYTLWLAWKIARSSGTASTSEPVRPLRFLQAAAFQFANPKTLTMTMATIAIFAPDQQLRSILLITAIFGLETVPAIALWAMLGISIRRWLSTQRRQMVFNYAMAAILVASLAIVL